MKRLAAILPLMLLLFSVIPCKAAGDFYCEYTPKSEKSSLFYIDVYSERAVAGAVMELSYSESYVSYYSVTADSATATVRDHVENGKVRVAFVDKSAVNGKLCRLSFKALKKGDIALTLHMEQAVDGSENLLGGWNDYTLNITLSEKDIASSGSSTRSVKASSGTSRSSRGGGKSTISKNGTDTEDDDESDDVRFGDPGFFDLREDHSVKWMLIGAGIPVLIGMLIWLGFILGRKSKEQKKDEEKPAETNHEPDDIIDEE